MHLCIYVFVRVCICAFVLMWNILFVEMCLCANVVLCICGNVVLWKRLFVNLCECVFVVLWECGFVRILQSKNNTKNADITCVFFVSFIDFLL